MQSKTWIVKTAGGLWEILFANLNHKGIYLYHIYMFNIVIANEFTNYSAVACSYYKNFLYIRVNRHGDVSYHFVINKLIFFGKHHIAVKG